MSYLRSFLDLPFFFFCVRWLLRGSEVVWYASSTTRCTYCAPQYIEDYIVTCVQWHGNMILYLYLLNNVLVPSELDVHFHYDDSAWVYKILECNHLSSKIWIKILIWCSLTIIIVVALSLFLFLCANFLKSITG